MKPNTITVYFVGGALAFNITAEGVLHPNKSPAPHVPHAEYFALGTSNLSYTVSLATASGSTIRFSGDSLFKIIHRSLDFEFVSPNITS